MTQYEYLKKTVWKYSLVPLCKFLLKFSIIYISKQFEDETASVKK